MAKLKTGRHTSALKENRKATARTARNTSVESKIKTLVKKVEDAVSKKDKAAAAELLKTTASEWDKAVKRNVVSKNAANRQKARLTRLVSSIAG